MGPLKPKHLLVFQHHGQHASVLGLRALSAVLKRAGATALCSAAAGPNRSAAPDDMQTLAHYLYSPQIPPPPSGEVHTFLFMPLHVAEDSIILLLPPHTGNRQ